jgi:hypothetical protein
MSISEALLVAQPKINKQLGKKFDDRDMTSLE